MNSKTIGEITELAVASALASRSRAYASGILLLRLLRLPVRTVPASILTTVTAAPEVIFCEDPGAVFAVVIFPFDQCHVLL